MMIRLWRNPHLQGTTAFWCFAPVHRTYLEGQQRVEGGPLPSERRSSQKGGKRPNMLRLGKDWSPRQSRHFIACGEERGNVDRVKL
jgi:hypothetical protein